MPGAVNVRIKWTRASAPAITSPAFLVAGTVNTLYPSTTFTATGTAPITWSVTAGTLPAGMAFSSAGVLSGTPTATSSGSITFTATNAYGSANTSLTLTVNAAGGPVIVSAPSIQAWRGNTSTVGSVLYVDVGHYQNEYNYVLTGTTTSFDDDSIEIAGGSNNNGDYVGYAVCFLNQANPEQHRIITSYNGSTKRATLSSTWTAWGVSPPVVGTTIWGLCNDYPVDRRFVWKKDNVPVAEAIGGAFTPYEPGVYTVEETACFPDVYPAASAGIPRTTSTTPSVTISGTKNPELVYQDNLVWEGCFSVNQIASGRTLAFNSAGDGGLGSLYIVGGPASSNQNVWEISIPTPSKTTVGVQNANTLQNGTDALEGQRFTSGIDSQKIVGGMQVYGGKLILTCHGDYDTKSAAGWFWERPLNLSTTGQIRGPFFLVDPSGINNPRYYGGSIAKVPTSLQAKLGGPLVAGLSAQSIVSNTSDGPTYASFDAAGFAAADAVRGSFVSANSTQINLSSGVGISSTNGFYVGYYVATTTLEAGTPRITAYDGVNKIATVTGWYSVPTSGSWVIVPPIQAKALAMYQDGELQQSTYLGHPFIWDQCSSPYGGYAIPNGTKSVLAFGAGGNNLYTYSSPNQVRYGVKTYADAAAGTGESNTPMFPRCWAYSADELEQVRLGNVLPKNAKPYAVWTFNPPIFSGAIVGVDYDQATKRLFLMNTSGGLGKTIVHVYTVSNATYP